MSTSNSGAYKGFEGRVGRSLAESEPAWEGLPRPPAGAPNVVVILCDDLGFSDLGCYGSEIETPNLDRLASRGVRLADFHSTPLCAPSRAALLTGMNHHAAGVGSVQGNDWGFPGYRGEIAEDVTTMAELFRHNGYRTLMVGKWHLQRTEEHSEADRRDGWPLQRGFDRFYGFMWWATNLHHPALLYEDNHVVTVDQYPEGYYFTEDMTDKAIEMVRAVKVAEPETPFFMYMAHGAMHAPLMAKPSDMAKYRGRYDVGWDAVREQRFAKQKALGIVPGHAELPPRNTEPGYDSPAWDELASGEQRLFARHMEVYAAMLDNIDQNWGRFVSAVEEMGELDNTIVIFTADNGASREGGKTGSTQYFKTAGLVHVHADTSSTVETDLERMELIGGPQVMAHYPWGWAMACNTPFRMHKGTTFQGGHRVPFIFSWPERLEARGEIRGQYAHLTDVLPSFIDMIGLDVPSTRHGRELRPMTGFSFAGVLADGSASASHTEQYYEMSGHRAYRRDDLESVTLHYPHTSFDDERWYLYNIAEDPTQTLDVAATNPEQLAALVNAWDEAAWENQVYPIDDGSAMALLTRPDARQPRAITLYPGMPTLERHRALGLIINRSFQVSASFEQPPGGTGMLFAHGDQGGGYCLYIDDAGQLTYAHNAFGAMTVLTARSIPPGPHEAMLDVDSPQFGVWNLRILVDGEAVAGADMLEAPTSIAPFEGIDIGIDRRSPVSWDVYSQHGPFPYSGKIRWVRYAPGAPVPGPGRSGEEVRRELLKYQ